MCATFGGVLWVLTLVLNKTVPGKIMTDPLL